MSVQRQLENIEVLQTELILKIQEKCGMVHPGSKSLIFKILYFFYKVNDAIYIYIT